MFDIFSERLKFITLSLLYLLLSIGCSNGSSNKGQNSSADALSIISPSSITHMEGEPLSFALSASQTTGISYSLLKSEDSELFVVDQTSGVISSKQPLDYENPSDSNQDSVYNLNLIVSNGTHTSEIQELSIQVENIKEYEIKVHFPFDSGNLGGSKNSLFVRGHLSDLTSKNTFTKQELSLKVNGVDAVVDNELNWVANIPVVYGLNNIEISLSGILNDSHKSIHINNRFIPDKTTVATNGSDLFIFNSVGGNQILNQDSESGEFIPLFGTEGFSSLAPCDYFSNIQLLNDSHKLHVSCPDTDFEYSYHSFMYDLVNGDISYLGNYEITNQDKIQLFNDTYLVHSNNEDQITFLDIQQKIEYTLEKITPNNCRPAFTFGSFSLSESSIYEFCEDQTDFHIVRYDLPELSNSTTNSLSINGEILFSLSDIDFSYVSSIYDLDIHFFNDSLLLVNLNDYLVLSLNGVIRNQHTADYLPDRLKIRRQKILTSDGEILILGNTSLEERLILDLDDFPVELILESPETLDFGNYFYNEEQNLIKGFSNFSNTSSVLDLNNLTMQTLATFESTIDGLSQIINYAHYEPELDQFYISNFDNWGHNAASELPLFSIYDIGSGNIEAIFSLESFRQYLSADPDILFTIEKFVKSHNENEVLFSASFEKPNEWVKRGLYTYDLVKQTFATITEEESYSNIYESGLRIPNQISQFYAGLNGYILTSWEDGSVLILNADWSKRTLVAGWTEFGTSWSSQYNSLTNEVLFGAYRLVPDTLYADFDDQIIEKFVLDSSYFNNVASNKDGNPLNIKSSYFALDSKKQLIYQIRKNELFVLDIKNNERILLPIQNVEN